MVHNYSPSGENTKRKLFAASTKYKPIIAHAEEPKSNGGPGVTFPLPHLMGDVSKQGQPEIVAKRGLLLRISHEIQKKQRLALARCS